MSSWIFSLSVWGVNGLTMYPLTPASIAWTISSFWAMPVIMSTGSLPWVGLDRIARTRSGPLMVGIAQSVMTRSMASLASLASADSPSRASTMASNPIVARWLLMIRRIVAESSMTRIFTGFAPARKGARVEPEAQTWPSVPQATRIVELATALWSRQTGGLISFWPASVPQGDLKCQPDYFRVGGSGAARRRPLANAQEAPQVADPLDRPTTSVRGDYNPFDVHLPHDLTDLRGVAVDERAVRLQP